MATAAQRGMNARAALEAAVAYYQVRKPSDTSNTAQLPDVKVAATVFADWLDERTKEFQ